jgi:RHS repeat-associated protein
MIWVATHEWSRPSGDLGRSHTSVFVPRTTDHGVICNVVSFGFLSLFLQRAKFYRHAFQLHIPSGAFLCLDASSFSEICDPSIAQIAQISAGWGAALSAPALHNHKKQTNHNSMKIKPILTTFAVALAAIVQPALAGFTQDANGNPTHYKGIPIPPMQTVAEARAATEKRLAAIKAEEAKQTEQAATELATRNTSPATAPQELFFTGKPYLEENGQYLFLFRHYDPELARWTTADPSGFPDGANNAIYIRNSPVYAFDYLDLERQLLYERADFHAPGCFGWKRDMGDGIDWVSWYGSNVSHFFQHLAETKANPGYASLAQNFVLSQLGLTGFGSSSKNCIAYGGRIHWKVYRDVQETQTIWEFEFNVVEITAWQRSKNGLGSQVEFTPNQTSGTLTSVIPKE